MFRMWPGSRKDKEDETKQKKRLRKLQAVREAEAFKLQKFMDSVGSGAMDGDTDTWTWRSSTAIEAA